MTKRIFSSVVGAGLVMGSQVMAAETAPRVRPVSSQPVHPVLIRNEHGPPARVVVVDDQHVGIVYEGSPSHLVVEKFSLDELLKR